MSIYDIIASVISIIAAILGFKYSAISDQFIRKIMYLYHYKIHYKINKIYFYDCGNSLNRKNLYEYFIVKNNCEPVATLNQEAICMDFQVGDKFILTGPNTLEINIREEDLDKVLIYSIVKNTYSATLKFEKRFSNKINNRIKKIIMQSNK